MYAPNQPKVLMRPRSSLSTEDNRGKKSIQKPPADPRKNTSNAVLSACAFSLFVLCVCVICFLVLVGKNFSTPLDKIDKSARTHSPNKQEIDGNFVIATRAPYFKPKVVFRPSEILHDFEVNKSDSEFLEPADEESMTTETTGGKIMSKVIQKLSFRLPRAIQPKHYNLLLHPLLKEKTFSGNVTIRLNILEPISYIPVHAKKLTITATHVYKLNKEGASVPVNVLQTFEDKIHEYWVAEFKEDLDIGEYILKLAFHGSLTDRIVGFYQSSYYDPGSNETRWIATSKFEPTYARQAFPCFDEPAMKANFSVTLARPSSGGYIALSNMNQLTEETEGNITKVQFAESVKMSTYLACFIVCDFKFQSKPINTNGKGAPIEMRVFATPAQVDKVSFALDTGVKITEYYINYFQQPYPLPKLDMIAIPDFVSGAMEHWGLVTFRETSLLYDKKISSTQNKERIGSVVAHELAHMWFGNLVTMKWWNDLWLNEGFATYIQYKGVDHAHKTWHLMDRFITDTLHGVMNLDATLASHPIVQIAESPDQITELFDSITYSKGASIIRMLENYVGEKAFQEAVIRYLNKYKYRNAETDDFLEEVDSVAPELKVGDVMQTWTYQSGLPVVEVTKVSNTEYKLKQRRFLSNPEDENKEWDESTFGYKWHIPITYITSKSKEVQKTLFKYNDAEVILTLPEPVEWIKLNKEQIGYYRANYPLENWKNIVNELVTQPTAFSVADRAHLLNDAFALAKAEQLPYDVALDLTTYLKFEQEYLPWSVASSELSFLRNILSQTNVFGDFTNYARKLVGGAYASVGWNVDDDHLKNLLRVDILSTSCAFELPECISAVSTKFNEWLAKPDSKPDPDLRPIIYSYGMKYSGDEATWNKVWDLYKAEADASEKAKLMSALSTIRVPWILKKFIDLSWDANNVRSQDYFTCLQNIAANSVGEPIIWDYVREHWTDLVDRFGLNERYLGSMIPAITRRFATTVKLQEMEDFFKKYPEAGAGAAARKRALATVKSNIEWLKENKDKVSNWLKNH